MQQSSKWSDEEVKEAIRVKREAHTRHATIKTTEGWKDVIRSWKESKGMGDDREKEQENMGRLR